GDQKDHRGSRYRCTPQIAVISPSFLTSDFVARAELPALIQRHRKEGLVLLPIVVRPTMWSSVPGLAELQFANDPNKPLSSVPEAERDTVYASISRSSESFQLWGLELPPNWLGIFTGGIVVCRKFFLHRARKPLTALAATCGRSAFQPARLWANRKS